MPLQCYISVHHCSVSAVSGVYCSMVVQSKSTVMLNETDVCITVQYKINNHLQWLLFFPKANQQLCL